MDSGPPRTDDFSPAAVRWAVLKESLTHPITLYPGVVAVLGGLAGTLFASPAIALAGIGAALAAACGFTVNYFFRNESIAKQYFERLSSEMAEAEERRLDDLFRELKNGERIGVAENVAARAAEQFVRVGRKYGQLQQLFEEKLGSGEESVGSLWGAGEQVYFGVLDNLRDVAAIFRTISSMDLHHIQSRLTELSRRGRLADVGAREKKTLEKRMALVQAQLDKISELLARNEEAITQLEDATAAISALESDDDLASVGTAVSVGRLKELASSLREKGSGPRS